MEIKYLPFISTVAMCTDFIGKGVDKGGGSLACQTFHSPDSEKSSGNETRVGGGGGGGGGGDHPPPLFGGFTFINSYLHYDLRGRYYK